MVEDLTDAARAISEPRKEEAEWPALMIPRVWFPPDIAALVAPIARVWRFQHLGAWAGLMRPTPLSDAIVEHAYRSRCRA